MPHDRPGQMVYRTATKAVEHRKPTVEGGAAGIAIKQAEPPYGTAIANLDLVAIGEDFAIDTKGLQVIDTVGGAARGDLVYIADADNTLSLNAPGAGKHCLGEVVYLAGDRADVPTGKMAVDLDKKVA